MKKTLPILISLLFIASASYGQKGFNLSLEGSLLNTGITNQNTWSRQHKFDKEPTLGNTFGLELGYNFTHEWGVYTGFGIMNLGQNYNRESGTINDGNLIIVYNDSWEREISLNYIMVPLMFKYIKKGNKVDFIGGGGILLAFLHQADQELLLNGAEYNLDDIGVPLSGSIIIKDIMDTIIGNETTIINGDYHLSTWADKDVTNRFNTLDIFINLEAGARFNIGSDLYFDVLANFGFGLTDINAEGRELEDGKTSHNSFAGIKLRFGLSNLWNKTQTK